MAIDGTNGADVLNDTSGDDTINGLDGNDTITVTIGFDTVNGDAGTDLLIIDYSAATTDIITGSAPNANVSLGGFDGYYGDGGPNRQIVYNSIEFFWITTGSGNDKITTASGNDVIRTNGGNDIVQAGDGADIVEGGAGDDNLDGGTGRDALSYASAAAGVTVNLATAAAQDTIGAGTDTVSNFEDLTGSAFADTLTGNGSENYIDGGGGADSMIGGDGNDIYVVDDIGDTITEAAGAGSGEDKIVTALATYSLVGIANVEHLTGANAAGQSLTGNGSDNFIMGFSGNDILDGGAGNDILEGAGGADTLIGGQGNDLYYVDDAGDVVTENGGEGTDEVRTTLASFILPDNVETLTYLGSGPAHLSGNAGNNDLTGGSSGDSFDLSQGGNDIASGVDGDDGFFFGATFTAADRVNGGPGGNDQIGLQGDYTGGNALVLGATTITNIEAIVVLPGFSYNITANDGNVAPGGVLKVQATQLAPGQSLTFNGSAEQDGGFLLYGGQGNDNFTGGAGNDGFYFGPGGFNSSDTVNGGPGGNDQLGLDGSYGAFGPAFVLGGNITNVEVVVLLPGPSGTPNTFNLTTSDAFVPAAGTMTIFGLQVTTDISFDGSHEHDGAFRIYGGSGNDVFTGSTGNDWIFGGGGGDTLIGGAGADTFYYDAASQSTSLGFDKIFGFDDDVDKIDLPFGVATFSAPASGTLSSASFDTDLAGAFAGLTSHQAGMFTATGGDMSGRTFLVIDADGNAGYQAGSDYVMEIVTPVTPIDQPAMFI